MGFMLPYIAYMDPMGYQSYTHFTMGYQSYYGAGIYANIYGLW